MPEKTEPAINLSILDQQVIDGVYVVTAKATLGKRTDTDVGAIALPASPPEARAAAMMLAVNLAKRRVTRSIQGKPDELVETVVVAAAEAEPEPRTPPRRGADDAKPTDEELAAAAAGTAAEEPLKVVTDRLKLEQDVEQLARDLGILESQVKSGLRKSYGKAAIGDCTDDELKDLRKRLTDRKAEADAKKAGK